MSTAHIAIDEAGTNHLSIDGRAASPVQGTGQAAQETALAHVRDHAARTQQTVALQVQDKNGETFHLQVAPDGQVWTAPPAPESPKIEPAQNAEPIPVPRIDQPTAPIATEIPNPQPEPDLEATRERPSPSENWTRPLDQHAPPEHAVAPTPSPQPAAPTADPVENDPRWAEIAQQPATQGLRGTLNGIGLKLSPTEDELDQRRESLRRDIAREQKMRLADEQLAQEEAAESSRRAARARKEAARDQEQRRLIQTNFQGTRTVLVANPKGGSRKTTSTFLTAATMGIIRGGSVIAWDANETMGTLGERAHQDLHDRTVVDLLEQSATEFTSIEGSRLGVLDRYVRPQGDSHFDVLASDEDPTRQDIVDAKGFSTVHEILSRFYRMIFVDTGNNIRVPHFLAAIEAADQLIIPVAASRDSARAARKMMEALAAAGHEHLVRNAVVLIHDLEAISSADSDYVEVTNDVAASFKDRVAAIIPIPFDPALKGGNEIDYYSLQPATQHAYQEAAAAVASSLRQELESAPQR